MRLWMIGAAAILAGRERALHAVALAAALAWPLGAAAVASGALARRLWTGRAPEVKEIRFHHRVAAELRAGAALRTALAHACEADGGAALRLVARRLMVGRPIGEVTGLLATHLPVTAPLALTAMEISLVSGGRTLDTFTTLADLAGIEAELRRELNQAAAPGRFALMVVGGLPVAAVAFVVLTGRLVALLRLPGGPVVLGFGGSLLVLGALITFGMTRKAAR